MVANRKTLTNGGAKVETTINRDTVYSLAEFMKRTGLARAAVRNARKAGLVVRRCGNRKFLLGSDWIEFLADDKRADIPGVGGGSTGEQ